VAPGDPRRLAESMLWTLDNPKAAAEMGQRGYERLLDRFPIGANVRATEQLYEQILDRTTGQAVAHAKRT
jgi:hypothetical protein